MPKTYPKTQPKKTKSKKTKFKDQPKPVSLMKSKTYWTALTLIMVVFTFAYGFLTNISFEKEVMILGSILAVIGLAFSLGFKPSSYNKKATFIFVGASIIGFGIWAVIVLSFNGTGINSQIAGSIGLDFFAVTSLIICLALGAFIGDLIGKNREKIVLSTDKFRN
ncbi:MAG: hypothetical protein ABSA79_04940 [Candidatus Bathyarchaeia archaeon]|jgi:hypothetical protein